MNKLLIPLLILCVSCQKDEEEPHDCNTDECFGHHAYTITSSDRASVPTKDTTYKYASSTQDTFLLKFRLMAVGQATESYGCFCEEKSTHITRDYSYSIYQFLPSGMDLTVIFVVGPFFPDNPNALNVTPPASFSIWFSDTSSILKGINSSYCTRYTVTDYPTKQNDYDSLAINGRYYHNIIHVFDNVTTCATGVMTEIYYSRGYGLVRFKYGSVNYDLVP